MKPQTQARDSASSAEGAPGERPSGGRAELRGSCPSPSLLELPQAAGDGRPPTLPLRRSLFLSPPPTPRARDPAGAAAARGAPSSAGCTTRARRSRAPPPPPRAFPGSPPPARRPRRGGRGAGALPAPPGPGDRPRAVRPSPAGGSRSPGLGIKPEARAAAPGGLQEGRRGCGRPPPPRAPGTTHRELGRRPAVRAPGCWERRCWALRTGLAPLPPPLVANADLKPGERAEALRDRHRRVLAAQAPAGYLCVTSRRGDKNIPPSPKDGEGQEARHCPCAASINK